MSSGLQKIIAGGLLLLIVQFNWGRNVSSFSLHSGQPFTIACDTLAEEKTVSVALQLFARDCKSVLDVTPDITCSQGSIWIGTIGKSPLIQTLISEKLLSVSELSGKKEAFLLCVVQRKSGPILVIAGSDKRGTAYGIMEVSRLMGVSPWEWWADVVPAALPAFSLETNYYSLQYPSVEFRGVFINDEDWGFLPWSNQTYEPSDIKGQIGPRTHQRVFELLLRLRANTFWPVMHECSRPFYFTQGNKEMADAYGIYIGTSHCEPMMRNTNGEWAAEGKGEYDYVHNQEGVYRFWEKRVADVAHLDNIYTLGMRGIHDGKMQGAKTIEEQKITLGNIIKDQRNLLKQYADADIRKVPQVFIPYKEVLDVYNAGLQIPDDVTLMWCDDNYGYIRHFPDTLECRRSGGNGIYYHISYWGRPHDYLWLGTVHPALVFNQMKQAYVSGIQKIWILNVGDIKPSEYQIELFMDMAWNPDKVISEGVTAHLKRWLAREFGTEYAMPLLSVMEEHYRLAYIRKPEFMGNTRTEEKAPVYKNVSAPDWSEQEINERLLACRSISEKVEELSSVLPSNRQNAFFELVKYPVQAAAQMNRKILTAQLARHHKASWEDSDDAFDRIVALTCFYNKLNGGKWNRIMDCQPRRLPVFERVQRNYVDTPLTAFRAPAYSFNGTDFAGNKGKSECCEGLGYGGKALSLQKGSSVTYSLKSLSTDSVWVEVRLVPNHPVDGEKLRFGISVDSTPVRIVEYQTKGRSEEWKENVLRNQAIRRICVPVQKELASHNLTLIAIDTGVILDQILVYEK